MFPVVVYGYAKFIVDLLHGHFIIEVGHNSKTWGQIGHYAEQLVTTYDISFFSLPGSMKN